MSIGLFNLKITTSSAPQIYGGGPKIARNVFKNFENQQN